MWHPTTLPVALAAWVEIGQAAEEAPAAAATAAEAAVAAVEEVGAEATAVAAARKECTRSRSSLSACQQGSCGPRCSEAASSTERAPLPWQ